MQDKIINNEFYQFFIKILFPAFCAVGIKIAIEMKKTKTKVSVLNVFLSILIGVGGAYIASGWVQSYFSDQTVSIVIALIAILSEKVGEFLMYKLNVDSILTALLDVSLDYLINIRKKK